MKHPERVEDYLEHISQAIQRVTEYIGHLGALSALQQSQRDQDAVIRNIEIIGEAARQIQQHAPEFVTAHPELPWVEMRGMRNKVIHNYFDVDVSVVWRTVKDDLPRLKQQVDDLLSEHRAPHPQGPEPDRSR
ncbi:MAG: DUF86 domain-containing protein [Acetobacteraceae bacterium]|nr:DUF86 domain-containing protein [Acetobacteraceae bacterium]